MQLFHQRPQCGPQQGEFPMYRIALVNHADPKNPEHWLECRSTRRHRAVNQTRKVMSGAEPIFRAGPKGQVRVKTSNVMLFHILPDGTYRPVSLKAKPQRMQVQAGAAPVGSR
jgi:hypothetical protein